MHAANPSIPSPIVAIGITPGFEFICLLRESSSPQATNSFILRYRTGIGLHRTLLPIPLAMNNISGSAERDCR
jgi:hypothetical protein